MGCLLSYSASCFIILEEHSTGTISMSRVLSHPSPTVALVTNEAKTHFDSQNSNIWSHGPLWFFATSEKGTQESSKKEKFGHVTSLLNPFAAFMSPLYVSFPLPSTPPPKCVYASACFTCMHMHLDVRRQPQISFLRSFQLHLSV